MENRTAQIVRNIGSLGDLLQFEANARRKGAITDELSAAINARAAEFARALISERTGLNLSELTPAEGRIVQAVSEYVGLMSLQGKDATRTLLQLRNRGLIDAAESAVSRRKPSPGFKALSDANRADLSYERIVIDHPDEFSSRAIWFSRHTLGLTNETEKPPTHADTPTQKLTERLLRWFGERSEQDGGRIPSFPYSEAAAALDMPDMQRFGRTYGNIQSRIDYACYMEGLPPLGLTALTAFEKAWNRENRSWSYPLEAMQAAAQSQIWTKSDFEALTSATRHLPSQAHIAWNKELASNEAKVRAWAFSLGQANSVDERHEQALAPRRNPDWSRDELILALDLYLRFRPSPPAKDSSEVAELSALLGRMGRVRGVTGAATYRNANGVHMKLMNFRRIDPEYTTGGRVGLEGGNKEEPVVWDEFGHDPELLAAAVAAIRAEIEAGSVSDPNDLHGISSEADQPYWVFVCNPKKWAIDRFLDRRVEHDTWGVRPADRSRFAPGQLAIVRVGVDRRTVAERGGNPPLVPGIYALCEVESAAFAGAGANDEFWAPGEGRAPGWPTVKLRYLRIYHDNPLTIEKLRSTYPDLSPLLLNGFQAASFRISPREFRTVVDLLGEDIDELPPPTEPSVATLEKLAEMESKYLHASPEVKQRVSRIVERGPIGGMVKRINGFRCQVCEALGDHPLGFMKSNGEHYVEAHHVMPVSRKEVGSLATANVMTVCPNHHRQIHYGVVSVVVQPDTFNLLIDGSSVEIPRLRVTP